MRKKWLFIPMVFVLAFMISCSDDSSDHPVPLVRAFSVNEAEIASAANNFTFDLMERIEETVPDENYFISSFSISTALSMIMNGGSETTQKAFIQTMGLGGMPAEAINEAYKSLVEYIYGLDPSITLTVANSNWYSDEFTIQPDFANTLQMYYEAEIFEKDFANSATVGELNGWIENKTNGKIKNVLDRIASNEVMFLINAIYFKANWTSQFDPSRTDDRPFHLSNGETVDVPTMAAEVKHWRAYDNQLQAQIIELPYGNENYAFTIIMPDEAAEIEDLVSRIDINNLNSLFADSSTNVRELYLPKFQLAFKADIKDVLVEMGMPLTGLDKLFEETDDLEISQVIHQSFLDVNEEGSEAAAVTIIGVELTSAPAATFIDRPFVFLIRERNSGTILFSGKLLNPS